jgi:hypothetical protein
VNLDVGRLHIFAVTRSVSTDLLQHWKALAGDESPSPWEPHNAFGFFQVFRPTGAGVAAAFDGVPLGEEVASRLLDIYRATASVGQRAEGIDAYFIVRQPLPATPDELHHIATSHLASLRSIAQAAVCEELVSVLTAPLHIHVAAAHNSANDTSSDLGSMVYDTVGDWFDSLVPSDDRVRSMREAFYSIACDYALARYLMWPWYRHATSVNEPFTAYYELWRRGGEIIFRDSGDVTLVVPTATPN